MTEIVLYSGYFGTHEPYNPEVFGNALGHYRCVVFTDHHDITAPQGIDVVHVPDRGLDTTRSARRIKLSPADLFPTADWAIYLDNNTRLKTTPEALISPLSAAGDISVATLRHASRDCIYQEVRACLKARKDTRSRLLAQERTYRAMSYPADAGLFATYILVTNLRHPKVRSFMQIWFEHVLAYSKRDQVSMPVVARMTGVEIACLDDFGLGDPVDWPVFDEPARTRYRKGLGAWPRLLRAR